MLSAEFFKPVSDDLIAEALGLSPNNLANTMKFHSSQGFPEIPSMGIALLSVHDHRLAVGSSDAKDSSSEIRAKLYRLHRHEHPVSLIDLGEFIPGASPEDTRFALAEVVRDLMVAGLLPVVIGGSQDLTMALHEAYRPFGKLINISSVDSRFDLGSPDAEISNQSWL